MLAHKWLIMIFMYDVNQIKVIVVFVVASEQIPVFHI